MEVENETSFDEVLAHVREKQRKSIERNGTSSISIELPNALLKRINRRMTRRKINNLNDYFVSLVFSDLDS